MRSHGVRQFLLAMLIVLTFLVSSTSFLLSNSAHHSRCKKQLRDAANDETQPDETLAKATKFFYTLSGGIQRDGFKLALTDALASLSDKYDAAELLKENLDLAKAHPVMMFSWTISPACKKAKKLFDLAGVVPYVLELDQPWSTGNPIRAVLGRHLGRTSVPMIFIG